MDEKEKLEIHERITTLEGSMKTIYNRVDGHDEEIKDIKSDNRILHEMNTNIKVLAVSTENLSREIIAVKADVKDLKEKPNADITELKCDVKELKEKPGKRWDTLITVVITVIASSFITYLITQALNKGGTP